MERKLRIFIAIINNHIPLQEDQPQNKGAATLTRGNKGKNTKHLKYI